MSQQFKIFRVTALPSTLVAYSVYLVAPADSPDYVEMYVTDSTGTKARRIINKADIQTMINNAVAAAAGSVNEIKVVANYAALTNLGSDPATYVYVKDATGDTTVKSGGATYIKDGSKWVKVSEAESLDLVLDWSNIQNKPTSTPAQIDSAVANSHTHSNKTQLDKVGEDGQGNFTYNGSMVSTQWTTTDW